MEAHPYLTTLTDAEWELVRPLLPPPPPPRTGHPRRHRLRPLLDASFSAVRAGHAWRLLPQEWPPGRTVSPSFPRGRLDGAWEAIHTAPRAAPPPPVGDTAAAPPA